MNDDVLARVLRVWAADAAAFAEVLAEQEPSWRVETFPLAGGHLVLCGADMYINAAIGVGLDRALTQAEWMQLEERSVAVGVQPSIEVSPSTEPEVWAELERRGYRRQG